MKKLYIIFLLAILGSETGCKKFLDANPDQSQVLTTDNIQNLQLLLNDALTMNQYVPSAGEIGTDNVYLSDAQWQSLAASAQTGANLYIYNTNVFNEANLSTTNDWNNAYKAIFNANVVLDAIPETPGGAGTATGDNIKGQALFFRAFYFYQLLQDFAKPFDPNTASSDPGIVLRLTSDISVVSKRSSVLESYNQVIADLQQAIMLLPSQQPYATTPNRTAALGLLARNYLSMANYAQALNYSKQYLAVSSALIDYNTLSPTASYPIVRYNQEVTFHAKLFNFGPYGTKYARVNDSLFSQYNQNDLRRSIFFNNGGPGNVTFKGSYYGSSSLFGGIANDEMYLTAAECFARTGDLSNAMNTLNQLLVKRWQTNTFIPLSASNQADALQKILTERRKELLFRNLRWTDLRRLNHETQYQTTVTHIINGQAYILVPNDSRYTLKIPDNVIQLSGIQQN